MSEDVRLETNRLSLRPVEPADLETLRGILADPYVREFLCDGEVLPVEVVERFIADSSEGFAAGRGGLFLIEPKEGSDGPIGFAGLRTFFEEEQPQLLYALLREFAGNGYATEAARAVSDHSFAELGFDRLVASCDAPNTASQRVAERLGMRLFKEEENDGSSLKFYVMEKGERG